MPIAQLVDGGGAISAFIRAGEGPIPHKITPKAPGLPASRVEQGPPFLRALGALAVDDPADTKSRRAESVSFRQGQPVSWATCA